MSERFGGSSGLQQQSPAAGNGRASIKKNDRLERDRRQDSLAGSGRQCESAAACFRVRPGLERAPG